MRIAETVTKRSTRVQQEANLAVAAEMERQSAARKATWERYCPEDIKALVQDVKEEIETREDVSLTEIFEAKNNEDEDFVKVTLMAHKTIPGKEITEPTFYRGQPPRKKTPDTYFGFGFSLTYHISLSGRIDWSMGNPTGEIVKNGGEEKRSPERIGVYTMKLEDPKYAGNLSRPEENFEELAETLAQHLDQQHYRYQIREKPIITYPQTLPIQTDLLD